MHNNDDPPGKIRVDSEPTPDEEANAFSTKDERREQRKHEHQLAILDRDLGWIGKATGSRNASLNVASVILIGMFIALFICLALSSQHVEKIITAILTISGFIFGVKQGKSED